MSEHFGLLAHWNSVDKNNEEDSMSYIERFLGATAIALFSASIYAGEIIKFRSLDPAHPYNVSGDPFLPSKASSPVSAIVVIHGSGGKDERTEYFSDELPKHSIAAFVVDYKTGIFRTPSDRPPNDTFIAATYAALKLLESRPEIVADKIGVMGFSLGGQQTMSATFPIFKKMWLGDEAPKFRLHLAFYPG